VEAVAVERLSPEKGFSHLRKDGKSFAKQIFTVVSGAGRALAVNWY